MSDFPRAEALMTALPKDAIIRWLFEYGIGREAMSKLEQKLKRSEGEGHESANN